MPRYFFHLCRNNARLEDHEGQELEDADQAWEAARSAALGLMNSEPDGTAVWSSCYFEVANEHDAVVLEFPFNEAGEVKSQPS
jgi:hypothetical protein